MLLPPELLLPPLVPLLGRSFPTPVVPLFALLLPAPRDPQFEQVVFGGAGVDVLRRYRDGLLAIAASE